MKITIDNEPRDKPEPNKKLLKQIKSRKVGWMSRAEYQARKEYLDDLREREKYNDV